MYSKLVLLTCVLAFFAVVLSAYARLADAGLGCANWPTCYEENALKERQPPQAHAATSGAARGHDSWQWKLHGQLVQLLGFLAVAVCGVAWKKRKALRQSPLLPSLLLGLMVFLAAFGVWAFGYLPRPVTVTVHLASGVVMMMMLTWMALQQMTPWTEVDANRAQKLRPLMWLGVVLLVVQIMQGGWTSANFAALACTDFPLCQGALLPAMDFAYGLSDAALPLSPEKLTAIHWMHRVGALPVIACLGWLSFRVMATEGLRRLGQVLLGLVVLESLLGVSNVRLGLPLLTAVLHNAVAMLLLIVLVVLGFRLQRAKGG